MKLIERIPVLGRLIIEEEGQTLVFSAALFLFSVPFLVGIAVDAGKGYYAYERLQESTNAAALAGAAKMPDTTAATTYAGEYGSDTSKSGHMNASGILSNASLNVSFTCSPTVTTELDVACLPPPGETGTGNNVIVVTQTAQSNNWIGPLFGMPKFSLTATATASMNGGASTPYNIAVIIDTTGSMDDVDNGSGAGLTCTYQLQCAMAGFRLLLTKLYPCQSSGTCSTSTPTVDNVALYTFPAVTSATVADDYTCTSSKPTTVAYTFTSNTAPTPNSTASNMELNPSTLDYQVVSFENGYKASDSASTLVSSDPLAIAAGDGGSTCGFKDVGGFGTYYAQVIYAAQADLVAESSGTGGNGFKNAMIILSDGNATAEASDGNIKVASGGGTLNGTGTATSNPNGYHSYAYPSTLGECGQAVIAAQAATAAGTIVYTIGYGAPSTGSSANCGTDQTYSATVSSTAYGANTWGPGDSPCQALGAMASNSTTFYSDDYNGCSAASPSLAGLTTLADIFTSIADSFSKARLVPNSWASSS